MRRAAPAPRRIAALQRRPPRMEYTCPESIPSARATPAGGALEKETPGIRDLALLIRSMQPVLDPTGYCFSSLPPSEIAGRNLEPLCVFREAEGTTVILSEDRTRAERLPAESVWARITLSVHSSLAAVGFLAAVTAALAREGISVNPVSAFHHDHLFVPWEHRFRALQTLQNLSRAAPPPGG
jgi:hypothetical protein